MAAAAKREVEVRARRASGGVWPAYAACVWMVLFAAVHAYWAVGGTVGLPPGLSVRDNPALFIIDVVAIPLCLVGAALALAFVRPWGARLPRRLLMVAAWGTSALLVLHALPAMVTLIGLALGMYAEPLSPETRFSLFLYEPIWMLGGLLFVLAAWRFQRA